MRDVYLLSLKAEGWGEGASLILKRANVKCGDLTPKVVLVDTRQHPFGKERAKKKHIRYAIIENLAIELSAPALYEFYHGRQTIENFFKESKNPFNSGKMPSQKFRANEAYLQFVGIAYNCYSWFKKNFFHQPGKITLWKPQELN